MKCPIDGENLVMAERQGIEIDYCPKCRGVWLDRGELDKIIERATMAGPTGAQPRQGQSDDHRRYEGRRDDHDEHGHDGASHGRRRKRGGLLGELFDFG